MRSAISCAASVHDSRRTTGSALAAGWRVSLRTVLLGPALRSDQESEQQIGIAQAIPVLGLDALASASYGPEAALTVLLVAGSAAPQALVPVIWAIAVLLGLIYLSYRQTIAAYPNGGGSFTVAKENLGTNAGLVAAAALAVDYILNAAVAISAGVGAIISAIPALLPYTLALCLGVLLLLTIINLRGIRSAGLVFTAPTYAFIATLGVVIVYGVLKTITSGGSPAPVTAPTRPHDTATS